MDFKLKNFRTRKRNNGRTHFYFEIMDNGKRKLLPLGSVLSHAISKWEELSKNQELSESDQLASVWLNYINSPSFINLAPRTKSDYQKYWKSIEKFHNAPVSQIQTRHIIKWLAANSHRKTQANREVALISILFNHARKLGLTSSPNPVLKDIRFKELARDVYISDHELYKFLEGADQNFKNDVLLLSLVALRFDDCRKLTKSDMKNFRTGKTGSKINFVPGPRLIDLIKSINREKLFFHAESTFRKKFYKQRKITGIDFFTVHDLRAKAITDTANYLGQQAAFDISGHSSPQMTEKYIRSKAAKKAKTL